MGGRIGKGSDPPIVARGLTRGGGSGGLPLPRDSDGKRHDRGAGVWGGGQKQHKPITSRIHPRGGNWKQAHVRKFRLVR